MHLRYQQTFFSKLQIKISAKSPSICGCLAKVVLFLFLSVIVDFTPRVAEFASKNPCYFR